MHVIKTCFFMLIFVFVISQQFLHKAFRYQQCDLLASEMIEVIDQRFAESKPFVKTINKFSWYNRRTQGLRNFNLLATCHFSHFQSGWHCDAMNVLNITEYGYVFQQLCSTAAARLHTLVQTRPVEKLQESCFIVGTIGKILAHSCGGRYQILRT